MSTQYAVLAGCFAASGGAFGKLCGLSAFQELLIIRIICFGAMISFNTASMNFFVKALHQTESSLIATVISSTFNYIVTAVLGCLLFEEIISLYWWIGMFFIIFGLSCVLSEDKSAIKKE